MGIAALASNLPLRCPKRHRPGTAAWYGMAWGSWDQTAGGPQATDLGEHIQTYSALHFIPLRWNRLEWNVNDITLDHIKLYLTNNDQHTSWQLRNHACRRTNGGSKLTTDPQTLFWGARKWVVFMMTACKTTVAATNVLRFFGSQHCWFN